MNKEEIEAKLLQLRTLWERKLKTNEAGLSSKINELTVKFRVELEKLKNADV